MRRIATDGEMNATEVPDGGSGQELQITDRAKIQKERTFSRDVDFRLIYSDGAGGKYSSGEVQSVGWLLGVRSIKRRVP